MVKREPIECLAFWATDATVRARSTSGGLFPVIAKEILARGGVVFGAAFADDFRRVRHIAITRIADLPRLQGSKYVQSDVTKAYKECLAYLKDGREVLFSGTPCQVAALVKMVEPWDGNLITCDIVCHGTPEPQVFAKYIAELEAREGNRIVDYQFREKRSGWNFPHIAYTFANGKTVRRIPRLDPYYAGYFISAFLKTGCYSCPFASTARVGDFTLADAWRIGTPHPELDDNKGTSLVLVCSEKARVLMDSLRSKGSVKGGSWSLAQAAECNMPLLKRPRMSPAHDRFFQIFDKTNSFHLAAGAYWTPGMKVKALLVYFVKRFGWFYFKRRQM